MGQLSHDIRNGLNACELQLTFLGEVATDPDAIDDIKRLRAVLTDITKQLQAVRVAMSPAKPHLMDYPAADLFEDMRERFERAHPDLAARVRWDLQVPASRTVNVDPELVLHSGLELLKNALHFADKDTPVSCVVRAEGGTVLATFEETLTQEPSQPPVEWGKSPLVSTRRGAYGLGLFRARRALAAAGCNLDFARPPGQTTLAATVTMPTAAPV